MHKGGWQRAPVGLHPHDAWYALPGALPSTSPALQTLTLGS